MKFSYPLILTITLAIFVASSVATPIEKVENDIILKRGEHDHKNKPKIPPPPPFKKSKKHDHGKLPRRGESDVSRAPNDDSNPKGGEFDDPKSPNDGPKSGEFPKGLNGNPKGFNNSSDDGGFDIPKSPNPKGGEFDSPKGPNNSTNDGEFGSPKGPNDSTESGEFITPNPNNSTESS